MLFEKSETKRYIRYAGPFVDGLVVVDATVPAEGRAMLLERLNGPPHPKCHHWRLCTLTEPACVAWVRADGVIVRVRNGTDPEDAHYDELLQGKDVRQPMAVGST